MKEIQTPRKELLTYRRPKDSPSTKSSSSSDQPKKSHKVAKKSLNAAFSDEILAADTPSDSLNLSPVSEVLSDANNFHHRDSFDNLLAVEEAITSSDSSALSKNTTVDSETIDNLTLDCAKNSRINSCVEAEVVVNLLKEARVQVSSSSDVNPLSKKLLDALVEVSVKELCALPEEKDVISVVISERARVLVFCFAVWLITLTAILVFSRGPSGRRSSSFYPTPT